MSESKTSATGVFGKAQAPAQRKCWIEIQLVDENDNAVANMPWRAENEATRDKVIAPYTGVTDSEGILRIDDLLHPDLTLFVEAQPLADDMEQRPLSIERTYSYSMKMSPVTVDKKTGLICYYVVIGQLCGKAPQIPGWEGKELPAFHFPDPEFSGLTISNMYFNSKVIVKICPFRAWNMLLHHTKDYSIVNGFNLGLLADFAYSDKEKILSFFNEQCQDLSKVPSLLYETISIDVPFRERYVNPIFLDSTEGDSGEGGSQVFFVSNLTKLLVGWRGTEPDKLADLCSDGTFRPVPCPEIIPAGRCHKGFLDAFNIIDEKFKEQFKLIQMLSNGRELFITGHSLGGALTLIHASLLREYNPLIYTYGMPRVFVSSTVDTIRDIAHYRHVNDSDSVTSVPPELELDNKLYDLWGPYGIAYGFIGSVWSMGLQGAVVKFGDPYWHHGKIVCFFKAEQSTVKFSKKTMPLIGMDITNPYISIKEVSFDKCKLYLIPDLNEQMFCTTASEQHKFIKCLSSDSLKRYFPKNSNPDLDSWTNPSNHSMSNKYMPFINNEMIELIEPERQMERIHKRNKFASVVDNASQSTGNISENEVGRNRLFLSMQDMLPQTLKISKSESNWVNALERFINRATEKYESID